MKPLHSERFRLPKTDENAISGRMRAAAVTMNAEGRGTLSLPKSVVTTAGRAGREAAQLRCILTERFDPLEILVQNAARMESCARQARSDRTKNLPRVGARTRIERVISALIGPGDALLNADRLTLGVASFDDVQPLEMAELWAVPEAVRVGILREYVRVARTILALSAERKAAEAWAAGERIALKGRGPAFFEHALFLTAEQEEPKRRAILESEIARLNMTAEQIIDLAHSQASHARARLENLAAARRMIDGLDWSECFAELSAVEQELRRDPAGIYPRMEEDSRAAVRRELAILSDRLKLSELTLARHAVGLAEMAEESVPARRTVCFWLYSDEGRRALAARVGNAKAVLPRMIPDPTGRISVAIIAGLFALAYSVYLMVVKDILFAGMGIPLAWAAGMAILGRSFSKFVKPMKLLKLEFEKIPDEWRTLTVIPALLSSKQRASEICDQIEATGCLERDKNLKYLILGDFQDADEQHMPDDEAILDSVRARIRAMNDRAGEEKYYYLHRNRNLLEPDRKWMGKDRKRGALMDLNRLLVAETGTENAFRAESSACETLKKMKFRCVLTLDADTRLLPGTTARLIGTMAHPLNVPRMENGRRMGYAVLQPQMEMSARSCKNAYVELFAGNGGVNAYPSSVSGFWQDVTGAGLFGGKGLYEIRAFHDALDGALPEGRILSHDLIEGAIAGAAQVSDVCFYDGYPATIGSNLKRLNRWTRGDWQLLPILLGGKKYTVENRKLSAAERIWMLDNLLRSLYAPSLMGLLLQSVWLGHPDAFAIGLILAFLNPLLRLFDGDEKKWRRATAELATLPMVAGCQADAIVRTLWRLAFSKKHLLDWVTSADVEGGSGGQLSQKIAVILLIPGLFVPGWQAAAIALGALFWVAPGWIRDMEQDENMPEIAQQDAELMTDLARSTWRFFENFVTEKTNHLPPDNVQIDPAVGPANRTSPTNIGLYMASCVAARTLGFIDGTALQSRLNATVTTLERMEKWRGNLYNWYDIETLQPLHPWYVSAVDSGNLAACILLCVASEAVPDSLRARLRKLSEAMELSALYDGEKKLFHIGYDAQRNRLSESHYDLLASESRILSYVSIMLGQAPVEHWRSLGRSVTRTPGGDALLSWSGTMFEYLMPELLLLTPKSTLLGGTVEAVIREQKRFAKAKMRPWGVSESGHHAFDMHLNYQYRAFGIRSLSLSGEVRQDVVAPYASVMCAHFAPHAVAQNIREMDAQGWRGAYGMYEAADYSRQDAPQVVRSYMAHHQGMALCGLCNALSENSLPRTLWRLPQARAIDLLLEERLPGKVQHKAQELPVPPEPAPEPEDRGRRTHPEHCLADGHLLGGADATALVMADGSIHYQRYDMQATRFDGDFLNRQDGACVHVRDMRTNEASILCGNGEFFPGGASFSGRFSEIEWRMRLCVSPEDGTLFKQISLRNDSGSTQSLRVTDCAPVSLGTPAEMAAHPAFRQLFVESRRPTRCSLVLRRHARDESERQHPVLAHLVNAPGEIFCETDLEKLTGRMGATMRPGGIGELLGTVGAVLNPCSALEARITIPAGNTVEMHFAMAIMKAEDVNLWLERSFLDSMPERAMQLAVSQARTSLEFIGLKKRQAVALDRLSPMLFDGKLSYYNAHRQAADPVFRTALWSLGISGDLPVMLVRAQDRSRLDGVRQAIRAHEFYRSMGVAVDLVLLNGQDGYDQPVRDALSDMIACSHLGDLRARRGGVHLLSQGSMRDAQRQALERAAVLRVDAEEDFYLLVRMKASAMNGQMSPAPMLDPGESLLKPEGYGRFISDHKYEIEVRPDRVPPAPWSNLMTNGEFGILTTERGGGFLFGKNSRTDRLTPFRNDILSEGWGWMLYLSDEESGEMLPLLPGKLPATAYRAIFAPWETVYRFENRRISGEVALCVHPELSEMRIHATVRSAKAGRFRIIGFVDWLMGGDAADGRFVRAWNRGGVAFAAGTMAGVGYFAAANEAVRPGGDRNSFLGHGGIFAPDGINDDQDRSGGWVLNVPVTLARDVPFRQDFTIGWAETRDAAYDRVWNFYARHDYEPVRDAVYKSWMRRQNCLIVQTEDENLNKFANCWLPHQTLSARILGRTGLYQPGGAIGFRDQLQDMLAVLPFEPERVRAHILDCAAHQFEDGDAMHWWHHPTIGVRTQIRDDVLFLPYVTAKYVAYTQDSGILDEKIAYLRNMEIPQGREDVYAEMSPGDRIESLHMHCMRAFRRVYALGEHGLALMGGGDWNDGMNRVGIRGRGESVWLSEFLAACASEYAEIAPDAVDREWLLTVAADMRAALEETGWDGAWYLRAYDDDGNTLGSAQDEVCRIDMISQAWAVLAGLGEERCKMAIDFAWKLLVDEENGIAKLLDPPFDEDGIDPGYIRGYPAGVRENGGQYTHGACWLLLALIRLGDAERAHRLLKMLLPVEKDVETYRVEPYVLAADVYAGAHPGRGGWTWYTGSAAWLQVCILALLGFERRGDRVRMCALLADWESASVAVQFGNSRYELISRKGEAVISLDGQPVCGGWVTMIDDGRAHVAVFPPR